MGPVCMSRHKGQRKSGDGMAGVAAADLPAHYLKNYLCDLGPRFCPICFSKCAFGERHLALRRAEKARGFTNAREQCAAPAGR